LTILSAVTLASSQTPSWYNLTGKAYPQVNKDNSVTFTFYAPSANAVVLSLGRDYVMNRNENGLWSVTSDPQEYGFHYYSLKVGGLSFSDPSVYAFYGCSRYSSAVEVAENKTDSQWYLPKSNVPHGAVRSVKFWSGVCNEYRRMYVYTRQVMKPILADVIPYFICNMAEARMKLAGYARASRTLYWIT